MFDLIDECGQDLSACGYETIKLSKYNITACKLFVDNLAKGKKLGFGKGHYFILNAPLLANLMPEHYEILKKEICERLEFLFRRHKIKKRGKILLVGIGNPSIEADSFGVKTVEKVEIEPFRKTNNILKLMPNVFANTGINAFDIVRLVVEAFDICAVVLVDSLATQNIFRLGTSIQFNDAGLTPGSAINNFGVEINKNSLNVPCFSIGVPMMIMSRVFVNKSDIILTEKDAKDKVEFMSRLVADCLTDILKDRKK